MLLVVALPRIGQNSFSNRPYVDFDCSWVQCSRSCNILTSIKFISFILHHSFCSLKGLKQPYLAGTGARSWDFLFCVDNGSKNEINAGKNLLETLTETTTCSKKNGHSDMWSVTNKCVVFAVNSSLDRRLGSWSKSPVASRLRHDCLQGSPRSTYCMEYSLAASQAYSVSALQLQTASARRSRWILERLIDQSRRWRRSRSRHRFAARILLK